MHIKLQPHNNNRPLYKPQENQSEQTLVEICIIIINVDNTVVLFTFYLPVHSEPTDNVSQEECT